MLREKLNDGNLPAQAAQVRIAEGQMNRVFRSDLVGQILGFIICLVAISGSVWLGMSGHEWIAGGIAVIPTAALIQAFRANFFTRKEPSPSALKDMK